MPPLGIIFGLFVAFTAAQYWTDNERANTAVNREASALREVVILAASFPGEPETRMRGLIRRYIEEAATPEWPMLAQHTATLRITPRALAEALHLTLALTPETEGQKTSQREIATSLENALDPRRQRIIVSQSQVNWVKWSWLFVQAACALLAIAMVHSDNRLASTITMGIFATGVAASMLLILSHDRPFMGEISIRPDPLLQVMPEILASVLGSPAYRPKSILLMVFRCRPLAFARSRTVQFKAALAIRNCALVTGRAVLLSHVFFITWTIAPSVAMAGRNHAQFGLFCGPSNVSG